MEMLLLLLLSALISSHTAIAAAANELNNKNSYVACYMSTDNNLVLSHQGGTDDLMTEEMCRDKCFSRRYTYFGLRASKSCYCGNTLQVARKLEDADCQWRCAGNRDQQCGSDQGIRIYRFLDVEFQKVNSRKIDLGRCKLSSILDDHNCNLAFDENENKSDLATFAQAKSGPGWWSAKTLLPAHIRAVRIYNRLDCCTERLNNFDILVDGVKCAGYKSDVSFAERTFACDTIGQEVKIVSRLDYLTLPHVEVFADSEMLPLSNCAQSTDSSTDYCSKAIDGNTNQDYGKGSCSVVSDVGWWSAETLKPAFISEVRLYNREDGFSERLNNFVISVDNVECASYNSAASFSVRSFSCQKTGEVVKITSHLRSLTLCEVQVFGYYL